MKRIVDCLFFAWVFWRVRRMLDQEPPLFKPDNKVLQSGGGGRLHS
jgi:hypothetical protein